MGLARRLGAKLGVAALAGLTGCAVPAPQVSEVAPIAPPVANPVNLVGSTPQILSAEFGQPAILRVDGPAQVWLYHSPVCGLNLILYPDASGTPRVADAVPENASEAQCVASLRRGQTDAALEPIPAS
jgi:hypothetical protein